jgi:hypothetical protein
MATINVLIAVDAGILATAISNHTLSSGTQENPTPLDSYSQSGIPICMMTEDNIMSNMFGQEEWLIEVNSGDTLEWEMAAFDGDSDYSVYPYAALFNPSTAMSPPKFIAPQTTVYMPSAGKPTGPLKAFTKDHYCAQATVLQTNLRIQYSLSFALVNNRNGHIIGYFFVEAFLQVS